MHVFIGLFCIVPLKIMSCSCFKDAVSMLPLRVLNTVFSSEVFLKYSWFLSLFVLFLSYMYVFFGFAQTILLDIFT